MEMDIQYKEDHDLWTKRNQILQQEVTSVREELKSNRNKNEKMEII